ncbi:uncharacterized protein LOC131648942 [Vicia villosa]|uniref:uncharacterized protein LOC131648942 n=1 Tax=Vicia villosa TaxID=3911 RepID=UPI00273B26F0|nr:uncharacterized protein LOC131648942 [Vicia villosa]
MVDRASFENVNVAQHEAELEPPPNIVNEFNPNEIVCDPGRKKQISEYAPDIQDQVRRAYILKGPMQPDLSSFPRTPFGSVTRAFSKSWYKNYTWLEYSEIKDAAYYFYCFLFKQPGRAEHFGFEVFTKCRYRDWKHASQGLKGHVGSHNSLHNSCVKHYDDYNNQRQSVISHSTRHKAWLHHYRAEIFYVAINKICMEMDHRFSEGNNIILDCFPCLDPKNSFSKFDVDKLARLADIHHADFFDDDRGTIRDQLTYILQVKRNASFSTCEDVQCLAMKMVQTKKHLVFPLVYKLIELALILPVSTSSVERAF